ncbi:hypothetical protein F2P79_025549 [Pimephales promelas]|nr:hypothetical protein F2P79_025549 [Pimephales promelas]
MFQSYSPTTRWDDLGQPGDMAEIHDISIPAQSHQRLRAPSQEQLTKTGPDTSQPRSPAQRTRTPPRKEPHRPGAQGCNAEDDNDPELPKEVERLQTALAETELKETQKPRPAQEARATTHKLVQQRQDLEHELDPQSCNTLIDCSMTERGGHTPQASPDQSAHFSQCTRAEKGGWKSPPSTTSLTIYKTLTFHLLSPTGAHDTDTQQDRPRRACATTTGSERVFCGTYNEPVTEEDASFKKLSLQKTRQSP